MNSGLFFFDFEEKMEDLLLSSRTSSIRREQMNGVSRGSMSSALSGGKKKQSFLSQGFSKVAKWWFLTVNSVALLLCLACLFFALFLWGSYLNQVFGNSFKISLLFIGIMGSSICLFGIIGTVKEKRIMLVSYFTFLLIMVLLEIGFVIFIMAGRDRLGFILESTWGSITDQVKNNIQAKFQCCGYHDVNDSPGSVCKPEWEEGCFDVIKGYMSDNIWVLILISSVFLFFELCSLSLSCFIAFRLPTKKQLDALELEEAWMRTLGGDEPSDIF